MQNSVTVSHTVRVPAVNGLRKFVARWYSVPSGDGAWLNTRNTHVLHLSYHAEFGCRSNHMGISKGPPFWGRRGALGLAPLEWRGVSYPLETGPSPQCHHGKFGRSVGVSRGSQNLRALGPAP